MFTITFQFFLVACTLGTAVVAILTHRADRREVMQRADRAYQLANEFINDRLEAGYYQPTELYVMKNDFDAKYFELIRK